MYCEQCGAKNNDDHLFCEQCGAKLYLPEEEGSARERAAAHTESPAADAGGSAAERGQGLTAQDTSSDAFSGMTGVEGVANMARSAWGDRLLMRGSQIGAAVVLAMILLIFWTYRNISAALNMTGQPAEWMLNAIGVLTILFFIASILMCGGLIFKAVQRYMPVGLPVYKQDLFWMPVAALVSSLCCIKSIGICGRFLSMDMNVLYDLSNNVYDSGYEYNDGYYAAITDLTLSSEKIEAMIGTGVRDEAFFLIFAGVVGAAVVVYPFLRGQIRGRL